MISECPDDMDVIIPLNAGEGFDGMFFSPCTEESGVGGLGINEEDMDKDEVEELINPSETQKAFVLVPCGFFSEEKDHSHEMN